jgi:hypothetical protein
MAVAALLPLPVVYMCTYFFLDLTYNSPQNVVDFAPQQRPLPND